jgi:hypothetical protein
VQDTGRHWDELHWWSLSHWSVVAYVIDTPTRCLNSSIIHTQPTSADAGDSDVVDTPADVGWKSGCPDMQIRPEIIE